MKSKEDALVARFVEALGSHPKEAMDRAGRAPQGVFWTFEEVSEIRNLILTGMKSYEIALRKLKHVLPNKKEYDSEKKNAEP
jgi:hypothetical protein